MIKYRVYDEEQKRYLNINNVSISGSGILRVVTYEDGYHTGISQLPDENRPRFIIEQYTGLKDKNGVEIYEGDIVKHRGYYGRAKNSAVEFNKGCFNTGEHDGSSTRKRPMLLQNNCEVMGNVHEDGELLEEK